MRSQQRTDRDKLCKKRKNIEKSRIGGRKLLAKTRDINESPQTSPAGLRKRCISVYAEDTWQKVKKVSDSGQLFYILKSLNFVMDVLGSNEE